MTNTVMAEAERTMMLYRALEAAKAKASGGVRPVRERTADEKRAYMREAQKRSRERQRTAVAIDGALPTDATVRDALADAALMILATGGAGAHQIRNALALAFPSKAGVPFTTEQRAKAGGLRPKLLTADVIKAAQAKAIADAEVATIGHVPTTAGRKPTPTAETQGFRRPAFLR